MSTPAPTIEQIKSNMRSTWMAGDFGVVAKTVAAGADEFIARLNIPAGARVLDIACGTGNTAIPLARRGCIVTGVDIAPNLLEQARARAAAEHLAITFDEGDAEALPYGDATFDAVTTMFGAMFAPRPELVASEMARVLRPGGLLAMGNWGPGAFVARMFKVGSSHVPPPPGIQPPILWGDDATVRQRLAPYFTRHRRHAHPTRLRSPHQASRSRRLLPHLLRPHQSRLLQTRRSRTEGPLRRSRTTLVLCEHRARPRQSHAHQARVHSDHRHAQVTTAQPAAAPPP